MQLSVKGWFSFQSQISSDQIYVPCTLFYTLLHLFPLRASTSLGSSRGRRSSKIVRFCGALLNCKLVGQRCCSGKRVWMPHRIEPASPRSWIVCNLLAQPGDSSSMLAWPLLLMRIRVVRFGFLWFRWLSWLLSRVPRSPHLLGFLSLSRATPFFHFIALGLCCVRSSPPPPLLRCGLSTFYYTDVLSIWLPLIWLFSRSSSFVFPLRRPWTVSSLSLTGTVYWSKWLGLLIASRQRASKHL